MSTNTTQKAIRTRVENDVGVPRHTLDQTPLQASADILEATELSALPMKVTDLAELEGAQLEADAGAAVRSARRSRDQTDEDLKFVRQELKEMKVDYDARLAEMKAHYDDKLAEQGSQLKILLMESAEYHKVCRRYVTEVALARIEKRFGCKPEEEQWSEYLSRLLAENYEYFKKRKLDSCFGLLHKGHGTAFAAGNQAAHRPDVQCVERAVAKSQDWKTLWDFSRREELEE